jgi:hypothetical protein
MINFPPEFVATRYPGYYWNIEKQTLYSIKVTGELREMERSKPCRFNHMFDGYKISVKGFRTGYTMDYLRKLTPSDTVVSVATRYDEAGW